LTEDLGKLIEYNTSCAPVFVQRAGVVALKEGEPVIARTVARFRKAPGSAFGPQGEGFVRWCFAASEDRLAEGVRRMRNIMVLDRGITP